MVGLVELGSWDDRALAVAMTPVSFDLRFFSRDLVQVAQRDNLGGSK